MIRRPASLVALAALALAQWSPLVHAAGSDRPSTQLASASRPLVGKRLDAKALGELRGGTGTVAATELSGTVSNNSASNVVTGANVITGGAFAGASGVPVVIQNSGNNVLIQSSTVLTVNLK